MIGLKKKTFIEALLGLMGRGKSLTTIDTSRLVPKRMILIGGRQVLRHRRVEKSKSKCLMICSETTRDQVEKMNKVNGIEAQVPSRFNMVLGPGRSILLIKRLVLYSIMIYS